MQGILRLYQLLISPINLIRASVIPISKLPSLTFSGYKGLVKVKIKTYGQIYIDVGFRNIFRRIKFHVAPNDFIPYPIILGREFLKLFNITLSIFNKSYQNQELTSTNSEVLHCLFSTIYGSINNNEFIADLPLPSASKASSASECPDIFAIECSEMTDPYDINPELDLNNRTAVKEIIRTCYLDLENISAIEHNYKMHIRVNSDVPISFRPRSLSQADKKIVEKNVEELLDLGFIRHSESPYAFPLVLVNKKDGSKRQCVDYRELNKVTIRDSYPLPLIDDCLEKLEGKKVFTTIDLKNGFHHIKVAEESIKYTAFVTPTGQYEYTVMPFGLKNGPMVFQRFINFVLVEFIRLGSVVVYMDDITLATETLSDHFILLRRVLKRLAEFRLEINFSKCKFFYYNISLLGFDISSRGISPNNKHIEAIRKLPYPRNVEELRKCLGLFSYFRRFIQGFSSIAKVLRDLIKTDRTFDFNDTCERAFNQLREKLVSAPALSMYNPEHETELHTDASSLGFGAVLLQRKEDNKFHPIGYFSKSTSPAESRYHSFELETLAIIYALKKFRIYLDGIPFKIVTDCNSLALTLNRKSINARIARWALELENYNYSIEHRKSTSMNHVDTLSRFQTKVIPDSENSVGIICVLHADDIDSQLSITQTRDDTIRQLREKLVEGPVDGWVLEDGLVFRVARSGQYLLYVPKEMENNVIRQVHEKLCHMGISKCVQHIKLHYWFPNMQSKVQNYIKNCLKCLTHSIPPHCQNRTLHLIPKKPLPFDTVHLDHFGPLPSIISKKKHILVIVDAFTKFVKLFAVNSTSAKEVCLCLDRYTQFYSRPRRVIADRGTCFTCVEFSSYLVDNNVEHIKVATASPQANGQAERVNRVLKSMLAKISEPVQHSDWSKLLTKVEYAINNSAHSVTKFTPSELLFGVGQRGLEVDSLTEFIDEKCELGNREELGIKRQKASDNILEHQRNTNDLHLTKNKPHATFSVGDYVMIRNIDTTVGTNKKFVPKFRGPYKVHKILPNDRYVIRDIENNPYTQMPYDGILEASRIRHWVDGEAKSSP